MTVIPDAARHQAGGMVTVIPDAARKAYAGVTRNGSLPTTATQRAAFASPPCLPSPIVLVISGLLQIAPSDSPVPARQRRRGEAPCAAWTYTR